MPTNKKDDVNFKDFKSKNLLDVSYFFANLLNIGYKSIDLKNKYTKVLKDIGFDKVYLGNCKETDSEYMLLTKGKNVILVVPGTESKKDVKVDVSSNAYVYKMLNDYDKAKMSMAKKLKKAMKIGFVHWGFFYSGYCLYHDISLQARKMGIDLWSSKIFITGHSLGASSKSHLAYFMSRLFPIQLSVGFGSPDPGRRKFKKKHNDVIKGYEFTRQSDIVPYSTLGVLGFKGVGVRLFLTSVNKVLFKNVGFFNPLRWKDRGKNKKYDGTHDHYIPQYIKSLSIARKNETIAF